MMIADYTKALDKAHAACSSWPHFNKSNIDEYLAYTLYSFGNVRSIEKAEKIVADWKHSRSVTV